MAYQGQRQACAAVADCLAAATVIQAQHPVVAFVGVHPFVPIAAVVVSVVDLAAAAVDKEVVAVWAPAVVDNDVPIVLPLMSVDLVDPMGHQVVLPFWLEQCPMFVGKELKDIDCDTD